MWEDGFEHIRRYNERIDIENYTSPLTIPRSDSAIWSNISRKISVFSSEENSKANSEVRFNENVHNLMSGSINLVNFIIESHSKTSIKTIVFLDKSARLAAHIFRVLWSTLKKDNKIPAGIDIPLIKFINVGLGENHKHDAKKSLNLASQVFPKKELAGKGILVIDEIIDSGGSLRRAMKSLEEMYNSKAQGMANFTDLPRWYRNRKLKGVQDPNLPEEIYYYLEKSDKEVFDFLESIFKKKLPNEFLLNFLDDLKTMEYTDFFKKYLKDENLQVEESFLLKVYNELSIPLEKVASIDIVKYFKSFGGFTTLRPNKEILRMSYRYRKYLSKMVELTSDHILSN